MQQDPTDILQLCSPLVEIAANQRELNQSIREIVARRAAEGAGASGPGEEERLSTLRRQYDELKSLGSQHFNTLLGYLLDRFGGEITEEEFKAAWASPAAFATDPKALSTVSDNLVPIVVVHQLLRGHGLTCAFNAAPYWKEFSDRYSSWFINRRPEARA